MSFLELIFLIFTFIGLFVLGKKRVRLALEDSKHRKSKSLHHFYGIYLGTLTIVPIVIVLYINKALGIDDVFLDTNVPFHPFLILTSGILGFLYAWPRIRPGFRAHKKIEGWIKKALLAASSIAVIVTFMIAFSMIIESVRFFSHVPIFDFLIGTEWRPDGAGESMGSFGAASLFVGTFLITVIALLIAIPMGVLSAVYMRFFVSATTRAILKPILEILAGIPTVVYGFFAIILISPLIQSLGTQLGFEVASESAIGAGFVMGIMILPYVSSMVDDVFAALPENLLQGALAMGATLPESITSVIIPASRSGIIAASLLAMSRAIGETMLVVMALGMTANLTLNPLNSVTTVTVQIVSLLTGDQSFDSPGPLSAFALGITLFIVTLVLNMIALKVVKTYREKYAF